MARLPPVIAFAAPSGTGKTTLIEALVKDMVSRGLRVGVLKADAHRVVLDTPGKDSWRFSEAGAQQVAVLSSDRLALFERMDGDVSLVHAVGRLFPDVDLVLAEGFRRSGMPTVRVHRALGPADEGWTPPRWVVAWASDSPCPPAPAGLMSDVPVFALDDPSPLVDWLLARFLEPVAICRPTVVCPVATAAQLRPALAAASHFGASLGTPALVVVPEGLPIPVRSGPRIVRDLRPGLALLGALYTGLAAAETAEVVLVGPRYWDTPPAFLAPLLTGGSRASDIVYAREGGHPDPACAIYGHRCLPAIQEALLSGEFRMTGWWGQVRTSGVELPAFAAGRVTARTVSARS